MAISYNICPITGLSYSIKDDYKGQILYNSVHNIVKEPTILFNLCEKKSESIPKSFLVAGILLHLEIEQLIDHPEHEPKYLRGQINELLQQASHYQLVELFWDTRNTMAHLNSEPLKINLTTTTLQGLWALYDNLKAVARQDVTAADMETYIRTKSIRRTKEREELHKTGIRDNMSLKACCKRVRKLLPELHNSATTEEANSLPLASIKKAASFFTWCPGTDTPKFAGTNDKVVKRIIEILDLIFTDAVCKSGILYQDSIEAKSYQLVKKYLTKELKSVALDVEF